MPPPKKAKKDAVPTVEAPATHDLELHTAARADGLDQGIVGGKPVSYAVRGCAVCAALVEEGFSQYHPEAGRENAAGAEGQSPPMQPAVASPEPLVTIVEPPADVQRALTSLFAAAEQFQPGLADKLAPILEIAMKEWAKGAEEKAQFDAWKASVSEDLRLMKEAVSILHNNMSYLYKLTTENVLVDLLLLKRALNIKGPK